MRRALTRCVGGALLVAAVSGVTLVAVPGSPLAASRAVPAADAAAAEPAAPARPSLARIAGVRQHGDSVEVRLADRPATVLVLAPDALLDGPWTALATRLAAGARPLVRLQYDAAGLVTRLALA